MMIDAKLIAEVTKELDDHDHSISEIAIITEYFIKAAKEKGSSIDDVYQTFYLGTHSIMNKLTKYDSEELDLLRFIFEELALKYFSPPDAWRPI